MKNKRLLSKFVLTAFVCLCFSVSFGSAVHFNLNLLGLAVLTEGDILDNMMYVHFADNGNNFGGFMYFSNGAVGRSSEGEFFGVGTQEHESSGYECTSQIKGFYYNAERGDRLWPLDQDTWSGVLLNSRLVTTGGIYTDCAMSGYADAINNCETDDTGEDYEACVAEVNSGFSTDSYGYYGSVEHIYSGQEMNLIVGVEYDTGFNTTNLHFIPIKTDSDLYPSFVRIDNRYPVGFVYDYNGGVGLAGCRFTSIGGTNSMKSLVDEAQTTGLSNIFAYNAELKKLEYVGALDERIIGKIECDGATAEDSLIKIIVEGIMGLDDGGSATKFGAIGNSTDTKMQYFATKSVNNITMINHARKKAESLCGGKRVNPSSAINSDQQIVCLDLDQRNDPIDAHVDALKNKTLVVKGGDVIIKADTGWIYDIFIDNGDLLVQEDENTEQVIIKNNGFISDSGNTGNFMLAAMVEYYGFYATGLIDNCLLHDNTICAELNLNIDYNGDGRVNISDVSWVIDCVLGNLLSEGHDCRMQDNVAIASVIKGNFIVDGNIKRLNEDEEVDGYKLENKYFVYGKMTTKDDLDSLEETFSWRCMAGLANDNTFCPLRPPYQNAALVIIDQNYDSPLLKS